MPDETKHTRAALIKCLFVASIVCVCVCVCVCVKGGEGSQVQFGLQKNFCISAVLCLPDRKMSRTALQFLRSFSNRFSLLCSCLAVLTVSAVLVSIFFRLIRPLVGAKHVSRNMSA